MRELSQLIDVDEPAWPEIRETLEASPVSVEVLPPDSDLGRTTILQLQVTARSYLGAMALHCGGLLVDDGWLRVFGSPVRGAAHGVPDLAGVNRFPETFDPAWQPEAGLVVAQDVLGGVFTLNGAAPADAGRPGSPGEVVYFAPDSLRWEALGAGHSAWLTWLLSGALHEFYADLRWPGWQDEVQELNRSRHRNHASNQDPDRDPDQDGTSTQGHARGISVFPPLWSAEARQDLSATSRRAVPMRELLDVARDACRQFDGVDPGFLGAA
ncbi:hypothetical protein GCM10010218_60190 [Streptomyces mashuensis]|uniref:DUF2625 domain-containing protein n=1 Tax=Streptomyces mashuensis TaxID=33904 RepID=A0A919EF82_9ACTN|nr:DUF2625 domain-containing protein [Streptomyces mashuensis]GHF70842.1 hypothetical protein GCM10010218_60190 [Streptomyces mashuensis]